MDTIEEQLEVVRAQVEAAKAALGVIQTQLDKSILTAPIDGTVLFRFVDAGEVVQIGATTVILGVLDKLTITVYIPEDRYGEVSS